MSSNDTKLSVAKPFYKLTPRIVNTLFLLLFQQYFSTHPEYRYDSDDSKTMMDIAADYDEEDYKQKALPVMIVCNGPSSIEPAGIGTGINTAQNRVVMREGKLVPLPGIWDKRLQFNVNSSVQIRITATSKDDVEEIAFEVAMFLNTVKFDVGNIINLQNISSVSVSNAQQVDQTGWTGKYLVVVSMSYAYTISRDWKPVDKGQLLRALAVKLEAKTAFGEKPIENSALIKEEENSISN